MNKLVFGIRGSLLTIVFCFYCPLHPTHSAITPSLRSPSWPVQCELRRSGQAMTKRCVGFRRELRRARVPHHRLKDPLTPRTALNPQNPHMTIKSCDNCGTRPIQHAYVHTSSSLVFDRKPTPSSSSSRALTRSLRTHT